MAKTKYDEYAEDKIKSYPRQTEGENSVLDAVSSESQQEKSSQATENAVDNGANTSILNNDGVNNFAVDKSANSGNNMTPGYVVSGSNDYPDMVYQGANADGTLNVSPVDSPKMERTQMDKDGNLRPVIGANSELYSKTLGAPGTVDAVPGDNNGPSLDPRNGVTEYEVGEGTNEEPVNTGDSNKAEAQARQYDNDGLRILRQGISTEDGETVELDRNGKPYISDNPGVRMFQDTGFVDPDELERKRLTDEYLAGAPEATTKEEEDRIIRGRQTAKGIAAFGNLLGALANVWGTSRGAVSQTIPSLPSVNYDALREKYRQGRNALAKYKAGVTDYVNGQIAKKQKLELDRQKAEIDAQYKQARINYTNALQALKEAELLFRNGHDGMSPAEKQRYDKALNDFAIASGKLKMMQQRYDQMNALGWYNAATSRMNAETNRQRANYYVAGGGKNGNDRIYTPEGTYQIKPSVWTANIGALANATGVSTTKEVDWKNPLTGLPERKVVNKSPNELKQEIIANWNDDCTFIAQSLGALVADAPGTEQAGEAASQTATQQQQSTPVTQVGTDSVNVDSTVSNTATTETKQEEKKDKPSNVGSSSTKAEVNKEDKPAKKQYTDDEVIQLIEKLHKEGKTDDIIIEEFDKLGIGTDQLKRVANRNQESSNKSQEGKSVIKHSSHLKHRGGGDGSEKGTSSAGKDDANLTAEQKEEKEAEARRAKSGRKITIGK